MDKTLTSLAVNLSNKINNVGTNAGKIDDAIINILNAVIGLLGVIAVVVVVIGGFNYMTSGGDPGKVKKAKDTILYGLIGMVVCVLAAAIVNFVVGALLNGK